MRVIQREASPAERCKVDLSLIRLANAKNIPEPSEEYFVELSKALQTAIEVVERSLK